MTRTGNQAIDWTRTHHRWAVGYCQQYVRTAFDVASLYGSAAQAWASARHKHPVVSGGQVPRGVPVFWTGGSHGYGHVALSTGNGMCISTDAGGAGVVAKVSIDGLTARWGLNLAGWTEDINEVRVYTPKPPPPKVFEIRDAVKLADLKPHRKSWSVRRVQRRLAKRHFLAKHNVTGYFGEDTRAAYKRWQKHCGFRGQFADGIPGPTSLHRLGLKPR